MSATSVTAAIGGASRGNTTCRWLRHHLTMTTFLVVLPLLGSGGRAHAACIAPPGPSPSTFICRGPGTATENITADNADVSTAPGFSLTTAAGDGIHIVGRGNVRFTGDNLSTITGAVDGLSVRSYGPVGAILGTVAIVANGDITGGRDGIKAINFGLGTDLAITTGAGCAITGGNDGIEAGNYGTGNLAITANGVVRGDEYGIRASNLGSGLTITTGVLSKISGRGSGIDAKLQGKGDLAIVVNGEVTSDFLGLSARNSDDGNDLTITTGAESRIFGEDGAIFAFHSGGGNIAITANGEVTTNKSSSAIFALNDGGGSTSITIGTTGLAQGVVSGIGVTSRNGQHTFIANAGVVRNFSGESDDAAILTEGGSTTIVNTGRLIGTVGIFGDFGSELINEGMWNSAGGVSDFGIGLSGVGNIGTFIAADDGAADEATRLVSLEFFFNSGAVTLADGGVGDSLQTSGNYDVIAGSQGRLAVDAVLGPSGQSDRLIVGNNTNGTTVIEVNVVDVLGANLDGIAVVEVTGATGEEDFDLAGGVLNTGALAWGLRLDGKTHELFTLGLGAGSVEFATAITGVQEVGQLTMGTLYQRQADLRPLLTGATVTPVADYAEPVAPTALTRATPGFWFKSVGAYIDRDDKQGSLILDSQQTIWGGMAGFDFGEQQGATAWLLGAFLGYLTSDLKFDATHTKWSFEGPAIGLYATYLDHSFHLGATLEADFLSIEIDPEDLAPGADEADTDAVSIGGRIDTGYKFGEELFIEPQASLAITHTEIDDVDLFGIRAVFDDEMSIKGRLGLRLGHEQMASNGVIYSSDVTASLWQDFSGDNNVTIINPDFPSGVSDDPDQTTGDVSIGFSAASPEGWSGFVRAGYLFAEGYDAITGSAGVRFAW